MSRPHGLGIQQCADSTGGPRAGHCQPEPRRLEPGSDPGPGNAGFAVLLESPHLSKLAFH